MSIPGIIQQPTQLPFDLSRMIQMQQMLQRFGQQPGAIGPVGAPQAPPANQFPGLGPIGPFQQAPTVQFGAPQIPGAGVLGSAFGQQLGQEQGARSPEAEADLNGKLDNIRKLLAQQQKQFGQFGKAQGRFGKQFAGVQRRPAPGQRQQVLRQAFANRAQRRAPTQGQVAASRQKDTAGLRQFREKAAARRSQSQAKQSNQAKNPRRRVRGNIRQGLAGLLSRFRR